MKLTPASQIETAGFFTLAQAARLAGRSYSWARERALYGRLDCRRFTPGGPTRVTADSLMRLIEAERKTATTQTLKRETGHRSYLRLVVNNGKI